MRPRMLPQLLITITVAMATTLITHYLVDKQAQRQPAVVVDIAGLTETWISEQLHLELAEHEQLAAARRYRARADRLLEALSQHDGVMVFPKGVLLAGADDVTQAFSVKLASLEGDDG